MRTRGLGRSLASLLTVLGLGVVGPLALGATPAAAQPNPQVIKTHAGNFPQGGSGEYLITVSNSGDDATEDAVVLRDPLAPGVFADDVETPVFWN